MKFAPSSTVEFNHASVPNTRVIPYGDYFLGSFTSGKYDYFQSNTGFYKKLHNSKNIEVIEEIEFSNASMSEEKFVFCPKLTSPQAGLTRGSKRTFSKNDGLRLIQEKYLNGVLNA